MMEGSIGGMAAKELGFRLALRDDVEHLVRMLVDDALGAARETLTVPLAAAYFHAFDAIQADPNNELVVAVRDATVIGMLQITYIPGLSRQGSWRALIEAVRVESSVRSAGVGRALMEHAIERARGRGCGLVQLTTDRVRNDALRFYERLGFVASHHGMKLRLSAR